MGIIGWLVLGLVAGAIARLLVPGRDPMGWGATLLLGLAGSLLGGFLADLVFDDEAVGLLGSVVGAVIVLLAYNAWVRKARVA
ncbi:MAG: GlsB/YeaQ/YmgE family stress response membrane protein [Acidimicrobiia bacterium]